MKRTLRRIVNQGSKLFCRVGWSGVAAYVIWAEHSSEGLRPLSVLERRTSPTQRRSHTSRVSTNPDEASGSCSQSNSFSLPHVSSTGPEVMPKKLSKHGDPRVLPTPTRINRCRRLSWGNSFSPRRSTGLASPKSRRRRIPHTHCRHCP